MHIYFDNSVNAKPAVNGLITKTDENNEDYFKSINLVSLCFNHVKPGSLRNT